MAQWLKFDVLLPLWTLFLSTGEDQVIVVVSQKGQQMVCWLRPLSWESENDREKAKNVCQIVTAIHSAKRKWFNIVVQHVEAKHSSGSTKQWLNKLTQWLNKILLLSPVVSLVWDLLRSTRLSRFFWWLSSLSPHKYDLSFWYELYLNSVWPRIQLNSIHHWWFVKSVWTWCLITQVKLSKQTVRGFLRPVNHFSVLLCEPPHLPTRVLGSLLRVCGWFKFRSVIITVLSSLIIISGTSSSSLKAYVSERPHDF